MINQNLSFTEEDFTGQEKSARRKDMAGAFAGWLNSMSINPDPNLPRVLQAAQLKRADKIKGNRTVNMLEKAGRTDLADMVKAGTLDPKQAAAQLFAEAGERRAFERQKELARFQAGLTAPKDSRTAAIKEYDLAVSQGYKGTFSDFQSSGKRRTEVGTIPAGYELVEGVNEAGETVLRMEPIAGGPAAIEQAQAAEQEERKASTKGTMTSTILNAAKEARNLADAYSTGVGAAFLQNVPMTDARKVAGNVKVLQAQATIETLNAMRQESPTGGALGNVTERENAMLAAKAGLLDPLASAEDFKRQLDEYERTLLEIVHGEAKGREIFSQTRSAPAAPAAQQQPAAGGAKVIEYDAQGNRIN